MIILLGSSGYIGQYIKQRLELRHLAHVALGRDVIENGDIYNIIKNERNQGSIIINATGYTGKPNVDACEVHKNECYYLNVELPLRIAGACSENQVIYGHLSSGCIYTGYNGNLGFNEDDEPNYSWKQNNCSYYSGTKAKCEELLNQIEMKYVWRIRMPFNSAMNERNYLYKLLKYDKLINMPNSLSYIEELVEAMIDTYARGLEYGTYNLTNPGAVKASDIMNIYRFYNIISKEPNYITESELMELVKAPRSNCLLDSTKAIKSGLILSDCLTMVERSIREWKQS